MNIVLTDARNVIDPRGDPTGSVVIEALCDAPYTHRTQTVGRIRFRGAADGDIEMTCIYVDREARGHGVGSQLIDAMIQCVTSTCESYQRVWTEVADLATAGQDVVRFLKHNQFQFDDCSHGFPLLMLREIRRCTPKRVCLRAEEQVDVEIVDDEGDLDESVTLSERETVETRRGKRR